MAEDEADRDLVAAATSLAGADPESADALQRNPRRTADPDSAPSGVLRTPAGQPVVAIAVTPGGVAIPLSAHSLPTVGPPPCRDEVVSAVRRRGGVVGRRVRRRTGGSSEEGLRPSAQDAATSPSPPMASSGPPSAPSTVVSQTSGGSLPGVPDSSAPSTVDGQTSGGSLPGVLDLSAPPVRRSTVGLPNSNAPTNVFLRGPAPGGNLTNRLVAWFRDVRARRGP